MSAREVLDGIKARRDAALLKVESIHHIHGKQCLCGFESAVSRDRTKHIMEATLAAAAPTDVARLTAAADAVLAEADRFERLGNKHHAHAIRIAIENAIKEQS